MPDEADKRGEQHFYRRSSSCRKSFITFRDCRIEKEKEKKTKPSTCTIPPSTTFITSIISIKS